MADFNYEQDFKKLNFRDNPELYQVGKGEQGVLLVEPYKSEILPLWRFQNPEMARASAKSILEKFESYSAQNDFVGMDMARKYLQMGFTRSRRYANHKTGRKYQKLKSASKRRKSLPLDPDPIKAKSARIFKKAWKKAEADPTYQEMKKEWKLWYG